MGKSFFINPFVIKPGKKGNPAIDNPAITKDIIDNKSVNNFVVPSYNESIGKSNILARISTESAGSNTFSQGLSLTNDMLANDSSIKKRFYFGPVDINRMHLEIVDEFGRTLNLNNMDWSMALNLVCLYD